MSHPPTGPACGNNPNYRMSDGDRQAVADFKAYLADRAALRDRIAEVLWPLTDWDGDQLNAERAADAVMAVLPAVPVPPATHAEAAGEEQTDRLAQWLWDNCAEDERTGLLADDPRRIATVALHWPELRRLADEAQQQPDTETPSVALARVRAACDQLLRASVLADGQPRTDRERGVVQAVTRITSVLAASGPGRVADEEQPEKPCTCGVAGDCFIPAGHYADCPQADAVSGPRAADDEQDGVQESIAALHAIPLPGSNGISSCCGRPPCEFVGERVTRDPDKVTCKGRPL